MRKTIAFIIFLTATCSTLQAQSRPNDIRVIAGLAGWIDEVMDYSTVLGISYRRYLTPRVGIEPEFLYMIGQGSIRDITLIPNLSYDFSTSQTVRPYVIGGVGWRQLRQDFPGALFPRFRHNEVTFSGGFGVKFYVSPRMFIAPEMRLGVEPLFRASASIGFSF